MNNLLKRKLLASNSFLLNKKNKNNIENDTKNINNIINVSNVNDPENMDNNGDNMTNKFNIINESNDINYENTYNNDNNNIVIDKFNIDSNVNIIDDNIDNYSLNNVDIIDNINSYNDNNNTNNTDNNNNDEHNYEYDKEDSEYKPDNDENDDDNYYNFYNYDRNYKRDKKRKHMYVKSNKRTTKVITFSKPITSLNELIKLGESYSRRYDYVCNINLKKLSNIITELKDLDSLIGLNEFKSSIVRQIVFILLDIQNNDEYDMRHTILYGDPGTGKTTIAQIIGKIYSKLGMLSKGTFTIATRADFIGNHIGDTEKNTQRILKNALGGVLFIDEVYSLGPEDNDGTDIYSKSLINILNEFLSKNSKDFICVIAGYKDDIEKYFLNHNKGLERRFSYRHVLEGYNASEMLQMFKKFVNESKWKLDINAISDTIFSDKDMFKNYGGDVRTLFEKCKEVNSDRAITLPKNEWKILSKVDIEIGFECYKKIRLINKKDDNNIITRMYI